MATIYQIKLQDLATAEAKKVQAAMKAIESSTGDARKEFKELESSTKYLKKIQTELENTTKESSLLAQTWKKIDPTGLAGAQLTADLLAGAIQGATQAVINFGKASLSEFVGGQASMARVAALAKTAGDNFNFTAAQLNDMATEMESTLAIDDDLARSAEGIFISFQNISGKAFPRALTAAADMSQVFGSLESASTALGKALSNPNEGLAALSRIGVQFTDTEKKSIETMMSVNDTLGAQELILDKVEKKFGGTAKAVADQAGGSFEKLNLAVKDLEESLGGLLAIPLTPMAKWLTEVLNTLSGNEKSPTQMSLEQLREEIKNVDTEIKTAGQSFDSLQALLAYKTSLQNTLMAKEHGMNQQAPAGSEILTVAKLQAQQLATARAEQERLYNVEVARWRREQQVQTQDYENSILGFSDRYNRQKLADELKAEQERLKAELDAQKAADEQSQAWDEALQKRQEQADADEVKAFEEKVKAELDAQKAADEQSQAWDEALQKRQEDAAAEEEKAQLDALKKQKAEQDSFVSETIQAINSLAQAWETFSQQQIQAQIDAKEKRIQGLHDELSEAEREFQAELQIKKAAGENSSQFELEGLENLKKAKLKAADDEAKLRAQEASLKRQAFQQAKEMNIALAIMNGAIAAVKAYVDLGPIFGIGGAALVAGVTAAQVAVIASQEPPALADGGVIPATPGGRLVRVAEAGQDEAVIPLDRWGDFGGSRGGGDVYYVSINGIQFQKIEDLAFELYQQTAKLKRVGKIK